VGIGLVVYSVGSDCVARARGRCERNWTCCLLSVAALVLQVLSWRTRRAPPARSAEFKTVRTCPEEQIHLRSKFLRVKLPTSRSVALFRNSLVVDGQLGCHINFLFVDDQG
jgi:hypothetical protein